MLLANVEIFSPQNKLMVRLWIIYRIKAPKSQLVTQIS